MTSSVTSSGLVLAGCCIFAAVTASVAGAPTGESPEPAGRLSQHDVLPLLRPSCTTCHGLRRQVGGLDLRSVESILKGGKSGPAVVPGDPEKSHLVRRIAEGACPPNTQLLDFGVKLPTAREVE